MDNPVVTYTIDQENNLVIRTTGNQVDSAQLNECFITDRKNWKCTLQATTQEIQAVDGKITIESEEGDKRQITRLEWLQNTILAKITS